MVNFCAVLGCLNRIPSIVLRSKPRKQALSVERLGSPVLEGKILQLTLLNFTELVVMLSSSLPQITPFCFYKAKEVEL